MSIQTEINRLNDAKDTLTNWMDEQDISYEEGANLTSIAETIANINIPNVLNAYSDSQTDTYSCNYINSKTSYIEGRVYYGQSVAKGTIATIDYRQTYRIGTGMSLSNGVITINDDNVKIISINACVQNTTWTSGDINMYVFKNGVNQATSATSNTINGILSAAIPVSKGEQIEIKIYGSVAIKLENSPWSYLNVTAI